ncbi:DsrE family protein [Acidihalobacter yilgarnensis]|nr:DsrE family protein [Acidihalobacter yilgarnensis]
MKLFVSMALLGFTLVVATVARADNLPEFPGIESVPITPDMNYGGFFKSHQPVKLVFGVANPGAQLKESLINTAATVRYLKSKGYRYEIQIVLYGRAVLTADQWKQEYSSYSAQFQALHEQGVQFRVCHNSMYSLHVKADDIYPYMKIVPAGILQLTKKQMQGFAYISNR